MEMLPGLLGEPPRFERAQQVFMALQNQDSHGAERQALANAGVSLRRIAVLYPADFLDLLPGLAAHLRAFPDAAQHSSSRVLRLREKQQSVQTFWKGLDSAQRAAFTHDTDVVREAQQYAEFKVELQALQQAADKEAQQMAALYPSTLWAIWWPMANEHLLNDSQRGMAESLLISAYWDMFPSISCTVEESHG